MSTRQFTQDIHTIHWSQVTDETWWYQINDGTESFDQASANAKLFKASPDMFKVCFDLVEIGITDPKLMPVFNAARAIIKQVTP